MTHTPGRWRVVGDFGAALSSYDARKLITGPESGAREGTFVETAFVLKEAP